MGCLIADGKNVDTRIIGLNLNEIKNFLVLAGTLHFGRASKRCHLSPPALTRSVQRMEEAAGEPLFITPQIGAEVSGNEGILAMVRLGIGPEIVLEYSPFRKQVRKIVSGAEV